MLSFLRPASCPQSPHPIGHGDSQGVVGGGRSVVGNITIQRGKKRQSFVRESDCEEEIMEAEDMEVLPTDAYVAA